MFFLPHPPGESAFGRGSLLLGLLFLGLGATLLLLQRRWGEGGFWICLGLFFLCYGAMNLDWPRLPNRLLLALGMAFGLAAFALAVMIIL